MVEIHEHHFVNGLGCCHLNVHAVARLIKDYLCNQFDSTRKLTSIDHQIIVSILFSRNLYHVIVLQFFNELIDRQLIRNWLLFFLIVLIGNYLLILFERQIDVFNHCHCQTAWNFKNKSIFQYFQSAIDRVRPSFDFTVTILSIKWQFDLFLFTRCKNEVFNSYCWIAVFKSIRIQF